MGITRSLTDRDQSIKNIDPSHGQRIASGQTIPMGLLSNLTIVYLSLLGLVVLRFAIEKDERAFRTFESPTEPRSIAFQLSMLSFSSKPLLVASRISL